MNLVSFFKNIAIHAGLGVVSLLSLIGIGATPLPHPTVATTTATISPHVSVKPVSFPTIATIQKIIASSSSKVPKAVPIAQGTQTEIAGAVVPDSPTHSAINDATRQAIVNILCVSRGGGDISSISGSGVIIAENGIILTNAHIAQFFLLYNYPTLGNISCIIRTGSPAKPAYRAELLFISPEWIHDNARDLLEKNPLGTGENDFAFLHIISSIDQQTPLPSVFPFIPLDSQTIPEVDGGVLLAGYPAEFLGSFTIENNLYGVSSFALINTLYVYTLGTNIPDLIAVGGTPVSQKGSSGGGVINAANGKLIGMVVTSTEGATTALRDLRAITLSHIERSLAKNWQTSIEMLLAGDPSQTAANFNHTLAPTLTKILTSVFENN